MQMCWPLSRPSPRAPTSRARPPASGAISNTATSAPAAAHSVAAVRPAQPAPTTAIRAGKVIRSCPLASAPIRTHRDPEFADWGQRDALVQDTEAIGLDLAKQAAIDVGHHQAGLLRSAV